MNYLSFTDTAKCAKISFVHENKASISSAFEITEKVVIELRIRRSIGAINPTLEFYDEAISCVILKVIGEYDRRDGNFDIYRFVPDISSLGIGLYFFRVLIKVFEKTLYGSMSDGKISFSENNYLSGLHQLSVCRFLYDEPSELYGGIIYHVFVDRFRRCGRFEMHEGARLIDGEWEEIPEFPEYAGAPVKNNTFYGGSLYGVIEKLDYISSLGVNVIYLSPIFESVSNHKYDTADYLRVDPGFGGDTGLCDLLKEASARGIRIILDGVFNHTGADSRYFNKFSRYDEIGAYQSRGSRYYDWYTFKTYPDSYVSWWDIEILPRINPDIVSCCDFFVGGGGVIEKYRDMGVYGFRLDVCDELSDKFIAKIKDKLSKNGENILYGEVWEDASNKIAYDKRKTYYLGAELDGVMNYPLREGLIDYVLGRGIKSLSYAINTVFVNAPDRIMHSLMNFLGTHDTVRILTALSEEHPSDNTNAFKKSFRMSDLARKKAVLRLKSLYTVLATLPGVPSVFYGDEAGLEGYDDPFNRMPYPWGQENGELIEHFQRVGRIRRENEVYKKGGFKPLILTDELFVFERIDDNLGAFITVFNNSDTTFDINFDESASELISGICATQFHLKSGDVGIYKYLLDYTFDIKARIEK